jgi:hypothetical protein
MRCAAAVLLAVVTATAGACGEDGEPKPHDINETGVDTVVGHLRILTLDVLRRGVVSPPGHGVSTPTDTASRGGSRKAISHSSGAR